MAELTKAEIEIIARVWDRMDAAVRKLLCSTPEQMSGAASGLDAAREDMRSVINAIIVPATRAALSKEDN